MEYQLFGVPTLESTKDYQFYTGVVLWRVVQKICMECQLFGVPTLESPKDYQFYTGVGL